MFKLPEKIKSYVGIIYFVIILLLSHLLWKLFVLGEESDTIVTLLGFDISYPFIWMSRHIASVSVSILNFIGFDTVLEPNNVILHTSVKKGVRIVWGCTGIKQAYIFFCIILFYRGPWLKKLWYIPLGLLVVYLFNIFRIAFITGFIRYNSSAFDFLHEHLFKYLFYGIIFLMWVFWEEKIVLKRRPKTKTEIG